jgi:membrane protein required for colicin V production
LNYLDVVIIVICAIVFILGFKDGFVRKLIGSVGFFLAIYLAIKFSPDLGKIFNSVLKMEIYFAEIFAGFLIFIVVVFISSVIKRVVHPFDKVNNMINRILGGIVGLIQILFFLSALLYLLNIFKFPPHNVKHQSYLYVKVYRILPSTFNLINNYTPSAKNTFRNYILEKDSI